MKSLRLFFITALIVSSISISAQNIFIQFYGQVRDLVTQQPVVNHMVLLTLHTDTTDVYYYSDIAYTDENGWYSFPASVPRISGITNYISLRSFDCMYEWQKQTVLNDGGALASSEMDFEICTNDTIFPGPCENRIIAERQPGRRVTFYGGLYSGQQATCLWNFGDGSTGTGSPVDHLYPYQGVYDVILQTITTDSCTDSSDYLLHLADSLSPSPCKNTITVFREGGALDVTFVGNLPGAQQGSFYWDFGDGTTASEKIVTHTYAQTGFYNVLLQTITSYGCVDYTGFPLALEDSLNQSEECTNFILPVEIEDLTVSLHGYLYNGMPASCTWSFGDGTSATGQYVTHTYSQPGTYTVSLQTLTADNCMASSGLNISLTDTVSQDCSSYFTYSQGNTPLAINFQGFTNSLFPTDFIYNFGDPASGTNNTSNLQNTVHTYFSPGTYTVTLYTTDSIGCNFVYSLQITVPTSGCDNYINVLENVEHTVSLSGGLYSGQAISYFWDLGDGNTSTEQAFSHTYDYPGFHTIILETYTNDSCYDQTEQTILLTDSIYTGCDCGFTTTPGNDPLTKVFLAHTTSIYPTQYTWSFADGTHGSGSSISHTFGNYGMYDVQVRCQDSAGCICISSIPVMVGDSVDPTNCENWINILGIAGHTINLYPVVVYGEVSYAFWDLGDGTTSTALEITHTYASPGLYTVTLQTQRWDGCSDQSSILINITDSIPNGCSSYFIATVGNNLYEVHFEGSTTSQYLTAFEWNFGDPASGINNTSTVQNPDHIFSEASTYSVTLITTDSTGCNNTFSAPVILSMFNQYNLYGQVFAGNQAITLSNVQLFGQDYTGSMNLIRDVLPDSADYYTFDTVSSGIYHILAIPVQGTIYAQQYLPTYFGDAFLWENSTPIVLGQPFNPYSIHLVEFDSISGGDGLINGELTTGGKSVSTGNQEILILDINNNPVKYMFSQADGSFSFAGLPYGEYKVYPVITGITTYPVTVVLSAANNTAHVVMKIKGQYVSGIGETTQADFIEKMYPNPAQNEIYVSIKEKGSVKIQVLDALGRVVYLNTESISSVNNVISVPVSEFKPGLYLLVIQDSTGNLSSRRFLKN